ncbi:hypothetical protein [Agathobacter rectalis]|uniref:hypothetical protein n=1 Tax=Agathobacter rectalis TaxID=39491 RepID=UPI0001CD43E1|nr:hypothetical protein [Agathobacter rectalis]CBK90671.1 hypothetical protein EUR_15990 [Agathobacter rectalis DSM 17629]
MKRKIITAILAITVVFSAASCGTAENKSSNTQEATVSDMQNSTERVSEAAGDTQSEEMTATVNDGENVPGSGTSKSDTSDAAASSSADSKNADSTVKKNSSDSKSSTKNSTSTAVNHNSTQSTGASTAKTDSGKKSAQSSGASNQTKPASAAGSKGTDSSSGTANKPAAHTHTWVKYVANTIQHEEQGHYETKVVKAAYDEPKYEEHNVCNKCGYDMGTDDWNVLNHENICDGSYSCIPVQVGTIHHDAETTQVWVVDKPAYTEYVYGEKCSGCGATK